MGKNEIILYGLSKYKEIIDKIMIDLKISNDCFDIKLMLTEALTNAFKHGNKGNNDKPIYLRYYDYGTYITFEIEDCGEGFKNITMPNTSLEDDLLSNSGRGLFLIRAIADKIELRNNTLIIQKQLSV